MECPEIWEEPPFSGPGNEDAESSHFFILSEPGTARCAYTPPGRYPLDNWRGQSNPEGVPSFVPTTKTAHNLADAAFGDTRVGRGAPCPRSTKQVTVWTFMWTDAQSKALVLSTAMKILVGARGFEPRTPCAQGRCATRLRYAPTRKALLILNHFSEPNHRWDLN